MTHIIVLLAMLASFTATEASPQRPTRDSDIQRTVQELIASKPEYANVSCSVDDAIVELSGTIKLLSDRRSLESSVQKIKHVARVKDLVVLYPANISDEALQGKIRERLNTAGFSHIQFHAHEGWVSVEGTVRNRQQRERLMVLVRSMPDVKEAEFDKLRAAEQ